MKIKPFYGKGVVAITEESYDYLVEYRKLYHQTYDIPRAFLKDYPENHIVIRFKGEVLKSSKHAFYSGRLSDYKPEEVISFSEFKRLTSESISDRIKSVKI